ncbi:tellurite resistance/C4-dicarboxylate transporter family protein [Mycobacterium sp.]|uniref:tellurite resistance/C4-dicarboxylate transporter family protein n=1 Tax=Mycobacterium sp. TaxID=1785 RepID=UPI002B7564F4|nr:tellurite resistance/C4-dicarboxylate transporter family protein [Mycobacterium sp.]HME47164.1 tellurite resistance/C4-dicarboxylate transporter family protein [Mycobacterium sp.]
MIVDIDLRPDVFAAVMATGIISIAADDHHYRLVSDTLAVLALAALLVLVVLVVRKLILRRTFAFHHLDEPDSVLRLFTFVAACGVLAARFEPHRLAFWVLGAAALLAWLALSPIALHSMATRDVRQLRDGARGAWLLAGVATSTVAIGLADASRFTGHPVLWWAALAVWVLAVVVYCAIMWLIVWRGVPDEPDSWILMGGLGIATLAGNHMYRGLGAGSPLRDDLKIATIVIWALAGLWIPALVYLSLRRVNGHPGALRFAGVWWAMVFPLGMYSTATEATSIDARLPALSTISLVFLWIALAAWLVVAVAGARAGFNARR